MNPQEQTSRNLLRAQVERGYKQKLAGVDWRGIWTPCQYAIDMGWGFQSVSDTARKGLSDLDAENLTPEQAKALHAWCLEQLPTAEPN